MKSEARESVAERGGLGSKGGSSVTNAHAAPILPSASVTSAKTRTSTLDEDNDAPPQTVLSSVESPDTDARYAPGRGWDAAARAPWSKKRDA